jgi:hypothetical protein
MTWQEALEIMVSRTKHERFRELCADGHPEHEAARRALVELAGGDPGAVPSLAKQAANFAGAMGRAAVATVTGKQVLCSPEQRAAREAICRSCEKLVNGKCVLCGCPYLRKLAHATEACPLDKWPKQEGAT